MFQKIDWFILSKLEKFAHWWKRLIGRDCFWLARMASVCYGLFGAAMMAYIILRVKGSFILAVCGPLMFLCLVMAVLFLRQIRFKEKIVSDMHSRGLSNPFKIIDRKARVSALFLLPICSLSEIASLLQGKFSFVLILTGIFGNLFFWWLLVYYFSACDPLPPAKSKVRQWLEKVVFVAKEALSPTPQPQPIPAESRFL